ILSAADFRANAFKNIIQYSDFDQVVSRLMIPERAEESALQVSEWGGDLKKVGDNYQLYTPDGLYHADFMTTAQSMLKRGVTLVGILDDQWVIHPIYQLPDQEHTSVKALVGIALNENALHGELYYLLRHPQEHNVITTMPSFDLKVHQSDPVMRILITGWVGSLPLLLKRLANDYDNIELVILDNLPNEQLQDDLAYVVRRLSEQEGALKKIDVSVEKWDFSDMEFLRTYVKDFTHIFLSKPRESIQEPYTVISSILSHIVSMVNTEGTSPKIFPVLTNRDQARMLQEELDRFTLPTEVHILVPDEFYGAYVAHTSFHMYTAENDDVYQMKRGLRHVIHDLMSEDGNHDALELYHMKVHEELPNEPEALYASLLQQGYIWIGYRLHSPFFWSDPMQHIVQTMFPREGDFHCLRQHQIIINPFGNPISRRSWENNRADIAELIVIGANIADGEE
ncbi:MAG: hypothetical protein R8M46_07110, partial [Ghiorsea sp.]